MYTSGTLIFQGSVAAALQHFRLSIGQPDLKVLTPRGKAIGVAELRDLIALMHTTPMHGERKIAVIDATELSMQAQNVLLKAIEEPFGDDLWILVTAHPSQLLPSVRSRAQLVVGESSQEYNMDILKAIEQHNNALLYKQDLITVIEHCWHYGASRIRNTAAQSWQLLDSLTSILVQLKQGIHLNKELTVDHVLAKLHEQKHSL